MDQWIQLALGQGGALVIMIWGARIGFKFLTGMIDKQEKRSALKSERFNDLHESTLEHISAHTEAVKELTKEIQSKNFCRIKKAV